MRGSRRFVEAAALAASLGVVALSASAAGGGASPVVPGTAEGIGAVPATITGTANSTHLRGGDPIPSCGNAVGVDWYTLKAPRRGAMLARLTAKGELDAAIVVYRIVRSQRSEVACDPTNGNGRARVAWSAYVKGSYLLGVARRSGSASGPYSLTVVAADPFPRPPGIPLPASGTYSTVNPLLDSADAWTVNMDRAVTYRVNLSSPSRIGCIGYEIYRPGASSFRRSHPVLARPCGGYETFTPGVDGGGTYSVVVRAGPGAALSHGYRLEVAPAGADDTAPGVKLTNGETITGALAARGIDGVDLYRFDVPRDGELTMLELQQRANVGFPLNVLRENGTRVAAIRAGQGRQVLRLHLPAGRYYAALTATNRQNGRYSLRLTVRDVTTTQITVSGRAFLESAAGTPVPLTVHVTSASHGGRVVIQIDHFDPLARWHFAAVVDGQVDANGDFVSYWTPPSVGTFRVRARFLANPYSSFSESGHVSVHVVEPLQ